MIKLLSKVYADAGIGDKNRGYQSVYDTYSERINRTLNLMNSYLTVAEGFPEDVLNGNDLALM
jgi:hypothetical protein